jgi:hypothetical protein
MQDNEADVVSARHRDARTLNNQGLYPEALEGYLWCFDHGPELQPSFRGVRVSFLLGDIFELARVYRPAGEALERRRDSAESRILSGASDKDTLLELGAINEGLSDTARTLALFDRLPPGESTNSARKELLHFVLSALLTARRYEDVVQAAGDANALVDELVETTERQLEFIQGRPETGSSEIVEYLRQTRVEEGAGYYEALLGTHRGVEATRCAERLLAMQPTGRSFATLIQRAVRAGAKVAARDLAERGLCEVPETQRPAVEEAAREIPD